MSADDGYYIIRKKVNGKYVLHHYFASDAELPDIDRQPSAEGESLEAVVLEYNRLKINALLQRKSNKAKESRSLLF